MQLSRRRFASWCVVTTIAPTLTWAKDMPRVDPSDLVKKYGKPDKLRSSEYEKPRPPLVTRMYEYRSANVRIVLLAEGPTGSPPPYASWRLIGYQDPRDNSVLTPDEAERRLSSRARR